MEDIHCFSTVPFGKFVMKISTYSQVCLLWSISSANVKVFYSIARL